MKRFHFVFEPQQIFFEQKQADDDDEEEEEEEEEEGEEEEEEEKKEEEERKEMEDEDEERKKEKEGGKKRKHRNDSDDADGGDDRTNKEERDDKEGEEINRKISEDENGDEEDDNDDEKDGVTIMMEVSENLLRLVNKTHSWTLYNKSPEALSNSSNFDVTPTFSDKIEISGVREIPDQFDNTHKIFQGVLQPGYYGNNIWKNYHPPHHSNTPEAADEVSVDYSKRQKIINLVLILATVSAVILLVSMVGILCLKGPSCQDVCYREQSRSTNFSDDLAVHKNLITRHEEVALRRDPLEQNQTEPRSIYAEEGNSADETKMYSQQVRLAEKKTSIRTNVTKKDILEWYI